MPGDEGSGDVLLEISVLNKSAIARGTPHAMVRKGGYAEQGARKWNVREYLRKQLSPRRSWRTQVMSALQGFKKRNSLLTQLSVLGLGPAPRCPPPPAARPSARLRPYAGGPPGQHLLRAAGPLGNRPTSTSQANMTSKSAAGLRQDP